MISSSKSVSHSRTWTFFQGQWHEGNVPIMGPRTHGLWLGSTVFDGARAFEGVTPDLDRHCARVNQSAIKFGLKPIVDLDTWLGLAHEGIARFPANAELYIRPDVLAAERRRRRRALRSGNDGLVPLHLRSADPEACRQRDHAVSVPQTDRRIRAGRCQGRLSLPELFACADRGRLARLPELPDAGHAGQRRGIRQFQRVHGERWRRLHAGAEWHLPERHHPAAGDRPVARRRRHRDRGYAALCRFPRRGRDLFDRQFRQGRAGDPHRRPAAHARPLLCACAEAVLGFRARGEAAA